MTICLLQLELENYVITLLILTVFHCIFAMSWIIWNTQVSNLESSSCHNFTPSVLNQTTKRSEKSGKKKWNSTNLCAYNLFEADF